METQARNQEKGETQKDRNGRIKKDHQQQKMCR